MKRRQPKPGELWQYRPISPAATDDLGGFIVLILSEVWGPPNDPNAQMVNFYPVGFFDGRLSRQRLCTTEHEYTRYLEPFSKESK
jgi:hypothetical protein